MRERRSLLKPQPDIGNRPTADISFAACIIVQPLVLHVATGSFITGPVAYRVANPGDKKMESKRHNRSPNESRNQPATRCFEHELPVGSFCPAKDTAWVFYPFPNGYD